MSKLVHSVLAIKAALYGHGRTVVFQSVKNQREIYIRITFQTAQTDGGNGSFTAKIVLKTSSQESIVNMSVIQNSKKYLLKTLTRLKIIT